MTVDMGITTGVTFDGPFFRDPGKTVRENITKALDTIAADSQARVAAASPRKTGAFAAGVVGRTHSVSGKRWQLYAVVSETHIYPWGAHVGETIRSGRKRVANRGEAAYRGGKLEARGHMFATEAARIRSQGIGSDLSRGLE